MKRVFLALLTAAITAIPLTASANPEPAGDGSYIDSNLFVQCGGPICWNMGTQKEIGNDTVQFQASAEFHGEEFPRTVIMQVNCTHSTQKIVEIEEGDRWSGYRWEKTNYDWSPAFPWLANSACEDVD